MNKSLRWLLGWYWVLITLTTSSVWAQSISIQATRANALHGTKADGTAYPGQISYTGKDMILNIVEVTGFVSTSHPEFKGRVTNTTSASSDNEHATQVASVAAAAGVEPKVKGVAFDATIRAFDNKDESLETTLLANKTVKEQLISNHSYVTTDIVDLALKFGTYDTFAGYYDKLAYKYPYWLLVTGSGNLGSGGLVNPSPNTTPVIAGLPGYDKLVAGMQTAKNPLVVGSIRSFSLNTAGYLVNAQIDETSSFGPTDDLRVKPEVVSFGNSITVATINNGYLQASGTSLSSPAVAAGGLLLQQYYFAKYKRYMRAATLKALLLHTAERITAPQGYTRKDAYGPDPFGGYGLINLQSARLAIRNTASIRPSSLIIESILKKGEETKYTIPITEGQPITVSICWTDPDHSANMASNSSTPMLTNDLNVKVIESSPNQPDNVYYPYSFYQGVSEHIYSRNDRANKVDPYEFIRFIPKAGMIYNIVISHTGQLVEDRQNYSLIVTGIQGTKDYDCEKIVTVSNPIGVGLAISGQQAVILKPGVAVTEGTSVLFHIMEACSMDKASQARMATLEELTELKPERDLIISPNPVSNVCRIVAPEAMREITIITQTGQVISRKVVNEVTEYSLDVTTLPAGLYLLRVEGSSGKIRTQKIIK